MEPVMMYHTSNRCMMLAPCCSSARQMLTRHHVNLGLAAPEQLTQQAEPTRAACGELPQHYRYLRAKQPI